VVLAAVVLGRLAAQQEQLTKVMLAATELLEMTQQQAVEALVV